MDQLLLDTNIISYLMKSDTRAQRYLPYLKDKLVCVSPVTLAELYRWPIVRNWGRAPIERLEQRLREYTLLAQDVQTCRIWATVVSLKGHPIAYHDAWIAAAALRHSIPLVTHNHKHFDHIPNLRLITA